MNDRQIAAWFCKDVSIACQKKWEETGDESYRKMSEKFQTVVMLNASRHHYDG